MVQSIWKRVYVQTSTNLSAYNREQKFVRPAHFVNITIHNLQLRLSLFQYPNVYFRLLNVNIWNRKMRVVEPTSCNEFQWLNCIFFFFWRFSPYSQRRKIMSIRNHKNECVPFIIIITNLNWSRVHVYVIIHFLECIKYSHKYNMLLYNALWYMFSDLVWR